MAELTPAGLSAKLIGLQEATANKQRALTNNNPFSRSLTQEKRETLGIRDANPIQDAKVATHIGAYNLLETTSLLTDFASSPTRLAQNAFDYATSDKSLADTIFKPNPLTTALIGGLEEKKAEIREGYSDYAKQESRLRTEEFAAYEADQLATETRLDKEGVDRNILDDTKSLGQDFLEGLQGYGKHPYSIYTDTGENLPQFVGGGVVGAVSKGASKAAVNTAAKNLGLTAVQAKRLLLDSGVKTAIKKNALRDVTGYIGATEGASVGNEAFREIMGTSVEQLDKTSQQFRDIKSRGSSSEEAREILANQQRYAVTATTGVAAAAIGKLTGAAGFEKNLLADMLSEKVVAKAAGTLTKKGIREGAKDFTREITEETLQEGTGQFITNVGKKGLVDREQRLGEGVGESAASGAVVGAGMTTTIKSVKPAVKTAAKGAKLAAKGVSKLVPQSVKDKAKDKILSGLDIGKIIDTKNPIYSPKLAVDTLQNRFKDVPVKEQETALAMMAVHVGNLKDVTNALLRKVDAPLQNSFRETVTLASDAKDKETFIKESDTLQGLTGKPLEAQKEFLGAAFDYATSVKESTPTQKKSLDKAITSLSTEDFTNKDVTTVTNSLFGSEDQTQYQSILDNPDAPLDLKEAIRDIVSPSKQTSDKEVTKANQETDKSFRELKQAITLGDEIEADNVITKIQERLDVLEAEKIVRNNNKQPDDVKDEIVDELKDRLNKANRLTNLAFNPIKKKTKKAYKAPKSDRKAPKRAKKDRAITKAQRKNTKKFIEAGGAKLKPGTYKDKDGNVYTVKRALDGTIRIKSSAYRREGIYANKTASVIAAKFAASVLSGEIKLAEEGKVTTTAKEKSILEIKQLMKEFGTLKGLNKQTRKLIKVLKETPDSTLAKLSTSKLKETKAFLKKVKQAPFGSEDINEAPPIDLEELAALDAIADEQAEVEAVLTAEEEVLVTDSSVNNNVTLKDQITQRDVEETSDIAGEPFSIFTHSAADTLSSIQKELEVAHALTKDPEDKAQLANTIVEIKESIVNASKETDFFSKYKLGFVINKQINVANALLDNVRKMDITELRKQVKAEDSTAANSKFFGTIAKLANIPYRKAIDAASREALVRNLMDQYIKENKSLEEMNQIAEDAVFNFFLKIGFPSATNQALQSAPHIFAKSNRKSAEAKNWISSVVNSTGIPVSSFAIIPNFFSEITTGKYAEKLQKRFKLTPEEVLQVQAFVEFAHGEGTTQGFSDVMQDISVYHEDKVITPQFQKRIDAGEVLRTPDQKANSDLITFFKNKKGELPQNFKDAAAMVSMEYLATRAFETLTRDPDQINALLGRPQGTDINAKTIALLGKSGVLRALVAADLGKKIRKQLNIKVNSTSDGNLEARLDDSFGLLALATMENMGLINYEAVTQEAMNLHVRTDDEIGETFVLESNMNFVRLEDTGLKDKDGNPVLEERVDKIIKAHTKARRQVFDKIFGIKEERGLPSDTPKKTLPKHFLRSVTGPSDANKEAAQNSQDTRFITKQGTGNILLNLPSRAILAISGNLSDAEILTKHASEEVGIRGNNDALARELQNAKALMDDNGKVRDFNKPFFFEISFWNNLRQGDTNTVSLQKSKMHRFFFMAEHWRNTIKLDGTAESTILLNNTKVAIMEGLDGIKGDMADKASHDRLLNEFHTTVMDANGNVLPKYVAAVDAISNLEELAKDQESDAYKQATQAIIDGAKAGENKMHSLDSLAHIAILSTALKDGLATVDINISREIDGVTNGVIALAIEIGGETTETRGIVEAGGGHRTGINEHGMPYEYHNRVERGDLDAYQQLAAKIDSILSAFRTDPTVDLTMLNDIQDIMGDFTRKLAKDPLMLTNYGSGIESIVEAFQHKVIATIYEQITEKGQKGLANKAELVEYVRTLRRLTGNPSLNIVPKDSHPSEFNEKNMKKWTRNFYLSPAELSAIHDVVESTYGVAIKKGVDDQLGPIIKTTAFINGAFRFMNEVMVVQVEQAMAEIEKIKGSTVSPNEIKNILIYLRDKGLLPGAAHASSESFFNHIQVTNTEKVTVPEEEGGKVYQQYDSPVTVTTYTLDDKGNRIIEKVTPVNSSSELIKQERYTANVGKSGLPIVNQAQDANIQLAVLKDWLIQNIHDATISGIQDSTNVGRAANRAWIDQHTNYFLMDAVNDSLQRFRKVYNDLGKSKQEKHQAQFKAINKAIYAKGIRVTPYVDENNKGQAYKNINNFFTDFETERKTAVEGSKRIMQVYPYWDQYPGGGTLAGPGITPLNKDTTAGLNEDGAELKDISEAPQVQVNTAGEVTYPGLTAKFSISLENGLYGVVFSDTGDQFLPPKYVKPNDALLVLQRGLFDKYNHNIEEINTLIENFKEQHYNFASNADTKGSVEQTNFFDNVYDVGIEEDITADEVIPIFEGLANQGNQIETAEHTVYLRDFLQLILQPALRRMDSVNKTVKAKLASTTGSTKGIYDPPTNTIYLAAAQGILRGAVDMSVQEVYVHELTHAVWSYGIDNIPVVQKELKRLFVLAERSGAITTDSFLQKYTDENGNEQIKIAHGNTLEGEKRLAQERYDYMFDKSRENYLHEFATFGLTNEAFRAALNNVENPKIYTKFKGSLLDRLGQAFAMIVEWINRMATKTTASKAKTVDAALTNLAQDINNVNRNNKNIADRAWEILGSYNPRVKELLSRYLQHGSEWYADYAIKHQDDPSNNWAKAYFDKVFTLPFGLYHAVADGVLDDEMYNRGHNKDNPFHKLAVEVAGANHITQGFYTLLQTIKHRRDAAVQQEADGIAVQLRDAMLNPLTDEQWEGLNAGALKTDLTSIFEDYTLQELIDFFTGEDALNKEKARIKRQILRRFPELGKYYAIQAQSLGAVQAKGKAGLKRQMLNAYQIAQGRDTNVLPTGDLARAEKLVDTLATLEAISYTSPFKRNITANILIQESTRQDGKNGMKLMMDLHREQQREALTRIFNNEKVLMIKGYTYENYDQFIDIQVASIDEEEAMLEKNYVLATRVAPDSKERLANRQAIYVSRSGGMSRHVTGLFGLTDNNSIGSKFFDIARRLPPKDRDGNYATWEELDRDETRAALKAAHERAKNKVDHMLSETEVDVTAQVQGTAELNFDDNHMIPIVSADGAVVKDFRYIMSEETKIALLGKKDLAHKILGRMTAAITNQEETKLSARAAIHLVHHDYIENYNDDPREYTEIGPDVTDEKNRERWHLLPEDTKYAMKLQYSSTGRELNPIFVRTDMLDLAFGYRKASLTEYMADYLLTAHGITISQNTKLILKNAGAIWQAVVQKAKKNIIIFLPAVWVANAGSNQLLLLMLGVPPVYAFKKQAEALTGILKYQKDHKKSEELKRLIKADPSNPNTKRRRILLDRALKDMETNPIAPLIDAGVFQVIVEDISLNDSQLSDVLSNVFPATSEVVKEQLDKIPAFDKVRRQVMIDQDTQVGEVLLKATQYSDFVSRYALYKYQTEEQGITPEEALINITNVFIDYDVPTSPEMQWLNDMGMLMYTKYYFRIQRVIMSLLVNKPVGVAAIAATQLVTTPMPDSIDGVMTPFSLWRKFSIIPVDRLEEATVIPAYHYFDGWRDLFG